MAKKPKDEEEGDIITGAQVMEAKTTVDDTIQVKITLDAANDMATAFCAILGRDKAAIRLGIKALP